MSPMRVDLFSFSVHLFYTLGQIIFYGNDIRINLIWMHCSNHIHKLIVKCRTLHHFNRIAHINLQKNGTCDRTRTYNTQNLNLVPLPIGLHRHMENSGIEPLTSRCKRDVLPLALIPQKLGGRGEIRTHGSFQIDGFQDRCNRPLCHPSVVYMYHTTINMSKAICIRSQ